MTMEAAKDDTWKVRTRGAIADLIAALGSIYPSTQLDRLRAARANLERAIEAFPPVKDE